ncbi:tetratricopeptide repeat protein [Hyphobacterium sp. HN65]|uniref:Tetratricopeptide repeat protein n=1 Tax=Hyphobacterium lacteum TaxID=3116575 RepID=A0ABU7LTL3_9PROT|nr:tetratricopeptide repeat protein [Hyphobacterium sp. HN65]MEE2527233.1 tetratricopeptide repeat protein [Hyphobacterium sp. HN65]
MSRYYGKAWIKPARYNFRPRLLLASTASVTALSFAVSAGADQDGMNVEQSRLEAERLAQQAGCAAALPDYEAVADYSRRALDWIAAGECAIAAGETSAASEAFWQAVIYRNQLNDEQRNYVYRSLGYQAEAAGEFSRSAIAWDEAARLTGDAFDIVMAARAARLDGRPQAGSVRLQRLDISGLEGSALALYFEERALGMAEMQPGAAAMYMQRAIGIEDRSYRRFQRGLYLQQAGDERGALQEFRNALQSDPQNVDILLSTAYSAQRAGDPDLAAELFSRVIEIDPSRSAVREDLGYALIAADREAEAAAAFRAVINDPSPRAGESESERADRIYRLRRQVEQVERRTYGFMFASYRDGTAPNTINLPETGPNETQVGAEFGWRPDALNTANTGITLFGRGYVSADPGTITLNEDTLQLGIGARWKPFDDHDFYLAGERLIAGGDQARDAWLLRASYGWSNGLDWNPTATDWNYTTVFADLAYIPDNPEFLSAYASVRQGRRFRTGDNWSVTPYVTAVGQWSDDTFQTRERLEVGPGVVFSRWLDEDSTTAPRQRLDLEMEYRFGVGDTDDQAFIARAIWNF